VAGGGVGAPRAPVAAAKRVLAVLELPLALLEAPLALLELLLPRDQRVLGRAERLLALAQPLVLLPDLVLAAPQGRLAASDVRGGQDPLVLRLFEPLDAVGELPGLLLGVIDLRVRPGEVCRGRGLGLVELTDEVVDAPGGLEVGRADLGKPPLAMGELGLLGVGRREALSEVLLPLDELLLDRVQLGASFVEHVDRGAEDVALDAAAEALAHALGGPVVLLVRGGVGIGHGGCPSHRQPCRDS
jgi:hypothetical protein